MSIIYNDKRIQVPGLETRSFLDGISWIKAITDFNPRKSPANKIVAHTHDGVKGKVLPGNGPNSTIDDALARYQVNTERMVSWDYTVDTNGAVTVQSDPAKVYSWQAGFPLMNSRSVGFEMIQTSKGDLYQGQLEKTVLLIDALTAIMGIQRQIVWNSSKNCPRVGVVKRLQSGGTDFIGILGHRNCSADRGPGDPGDHLFYALKAAGYECFDLDNKEDLLAWTERQKNLGIPLAECDGIPGPKTVAALKAAGKKHGLWVSRPIDSLIQL